MRTIQMTPEILREISMSNGGFETASLNDCLYLHFKGFSRIENLELYTGLKALWLESNGLQSIENLDSQTSLRCLYLQQNLICKIENLQSLESLRVLDISQNRLVKLENLGCLPNLQTINVSKNMLPDSDSINELISCRALTTVDLSNNSLDGEGIMETIAAIPCLLSLSLTGNPVMSTPQLRKKMICAMPSLTYLDRPIFEAERLASEAWGRGGRDEEIAARSAYQDRQRSKAAQEAKEFREWKAAKIAERSKDAREPHSEGTVSFTEPATNDIAKRIQGSSQQRNEVDASASSSHQDLDVSFFSSNFVDFGRKLDVSSFRAPSYIPDEVDYVQNPAPPLPSTNLPLSPCAPPPVAPPLPPSGTDFNELD